MNYDYATLSKLFIIGIKEVSVQGGCFVEVDFVSGPCAVAMITTSCEEYMAGGKKEFLTKYILQAVRDTGYFLPFMTSWCCVISQDK